jgi:hypothetical protein
MAMQGNGWGMWAWLILMLKSPHLCSPWLVLAGQGSGGTCTDNAATRAFACVVGSSCLAWPGGTLLSRNAALLLLPLQLFVLHNCILPLLAELLQVAQYRSPSMCSSMSAVQAAVWWSAGSQMDAK